VTGVVLDHLVVGARTLEGGVRWCEATLGVTPGPGGRHPLMGTHNRLARLSHDAFLEIIAVDPDAPAPSRARWFGLDDAAALIDGPRLLHWVARSDALEATLAALRAAGVEAGRAVAASRDTPQGRLEWRIAVRDDGALLAGGALPTLIDWGGCRHPAATMAPSGLALRSMTLRGVPQAAARVLGLSMDTSDGPALQVVLDTPRGAVELTSR
jgi:hypothetical protein